MIDPSNPVVMICTSVHPWDDVRIYYKEAESLKQHYQVLLAAPAVFKSRYIDGIAIHGLPLWTKKIQRIRTLIQLVWLMMRANADVYHLHDPELIPLGWFLKKVRRKAVIFDMHENTSELIVSRSWIPNSIRAILSWFFLKLERLAENEFDHVVLAESSYQERFQREFRIVRNFPLDPQLEPVKRDIDLIYIGGVLPERGAHEMLQIAAEVRAKLSDFLMIILGPISQALKVEIDEQIAIHGLENNVKILGRKDHETAMRFLARAKLGLAILHPVGNYMESLPTKLMEYMLYGVPFIASNFTYWQTHLNAEGSGWFFDPENIDGMVERILSLLGDDTKWEQVSDHAQYLAKTRFSWNSEANKLIDLYQEILEN